MKKKLYIGGGALAAIAVLILVFVASNNASYQSSGLKEVKLSQAKSDKIDSKPCAKSNDTLQVSKEERSAVEMAAIYHINDVPAGTNVDVRIASFSNGEAVGSAIYDGSYGTYNFTATNKLGTAPDISPSQTWQLTSFKPCKV